jgi:hypothetical protein
MLIPGGLPTSIGKERVDRTFAADLDQSNIQLFVGSNDPRSTRVFWAYKSVNNGGMGSFDKILGYDWALDKWFPVTMSGQYIASLSQPGITLEGVDSAYGSNIDALTITSLDDISNAAVTKVSIVDATNKMGFFSGSPLEATLETPEQGADGRRIYVNGFEPVSDAVSIYGKLIFRETAQASTASTTETLVNAIGICPQHKSGRYFRGHVRIPSGTLKADGTNWSFAAGVNPDIKPQGKR